MAAGARVATWDHQEGEGAVVSKDPDARSTEAGPHLARLSQEIVRQDGVLGALIVADLEGSPAAIAFSTRGPVLPVASLRRMAMLAVKVTAHESIEPSPEDGPREIWPSEEMFERALGDLRAAYAIARRERLAVLEARARRHS